jgi:hypothetical protein
MVPTMRDAHHSGRYGFTILAQFKFGEAADDDNGEPAASVQILVCFVGKPWRRVHQIRQPASRHAPIARTHGTFLKVRVSDANSSEQLRWLKRSVFGSISETFSTWPARRIWRRKVAPYRATKIPVEGVADRRFMGVSLSVALALIGGNSSNDRLFKVDSTGVVGQQLPLIRALAHASIVGPGCSRRRHAAFLVRKQLQPDPRVRVSQMFDKSVRKHL